MRTFLALLFFLMFSGPLRSHQNDPVSECLDNEQAKPGYTWALAWDKCKSADLYQSAHPQELIDLAKRYGVTTDTVAADPETWKSRAKLEDQKKISTEDKQRQIQKEDYNLEVERSNFEKAAASAVGALILATLFFLVKSKPWTWRINMQRLTFARLVSRADTKQKRLCLVATPVAFSIALWLLIRDTHWFYYFDEIKFITVLFVTLSITLPVISLSRLLDWVEGTK